MGSAPCLPSTVEPALLVEVWMSWFYCSLHVGNGLAGPEVRRAGVLPPVNTPTGCSTLESSPVHHLGITVELALVVKTQVSWP